MVTSSSPARQNRRQVTGSSLGAGGVGRTLLGAGLVLTLAAAALLAATPAQCADVAGGLAVPRGFYDYAVTAYCEFSLYKGGALPPYLSLNGRASGYLSYRDQIGLGVGSASLLARITAPEALGGRLGFKPYASVGPSFNYQYSWADLGDFGTISTNKTSTTPSVFVGADFFSRSRVTFFLEARETLRSDFTVDYVLFGLKYAGPVLPSIE
jgi:hypothetical protein